VRPTRNLQIHCVARMRGVLQQVVDVVGPEKAKRRYNCVTSAKDNHIKRRKCEQK
jgi:hypothetical protein